MLIIKTEQNNKNSCLDFKADYPDQIAYNAVK